MADPIRAELEALIAAYDKHGGRWPDADVQALFRAVERARAALEVQPLTTRLALHPDGTPQVSIGSAVDLATAEGLAPTIDDIWGLCEDHDFQIGDGASADESAEILLEIIRAALARWGAPALAAQPPAPGPASDGERANVAEALLDEALWFEKGGRTSETMRRAATLLRQPAPAPAAVPVDLTPTRYLHPSGATIERTRTDPDAWAVRRGSERMSVCGEWSIEPSPSERTADYLAEHSFPSPQAALEVLQHRQPPHGGEVQ